MEPAPKQNSHFLGLPTPSTCPLSFWFTTTLLPSHHLLSVSTSTSPALLLSSYPPLSGVFAAAINLNSVNYSTPQIFATSRLMLAPVHPNQPVPFLVCPSEPLTHDLSSIVRSVLNRTPTVTRKRLCLPHGPLLHRQLAPLPFLRQWHQ